MSEFQEIIDRAYRAWQTRNDEQLRLDFTEKPMSGKGGPEAMDNEEKNEPGFRIAPMTTGFQITFENGHTVSVQFGATNYCSRRSFEVKDIHDAVGSRSDWHSPNAEIAGIHANGDWIVPDDWDDSVHGWQSPADVLAYMNYVASLPPLDKQPKP